MTDSTSAEQTQKGNVGLKRAAAFLAGLSLYQMPHAAISAGNFTVGRFQIPQKYVGLYINRMIISYRIFSLVGITITTAYEQFNGPHIPLLNIGLFVLVALSHITLFLTYCSGGAQGHITLYYWIVVVVALIIGMCFVFSVKLASNEIIYLLAALPISGILASSYHISFIVISEYFNLSNIYYWLVFWQLICAISLISVTTVIWAFAYGSENKPEGPAGEEGSSSSSGSSGSSGGSQPQQQVQEAEGFSIALYNALSPLLLVAFGYGIQNMFYPSVAPYKIIGIDRGYKIDVAVLFTSAVPPLLFLYLISKGRGPDRPWTTGDAPWWHGAWAFFGIEVMCGILFFSTLHYPNSALPRSIRNSIWGLGFFTVLYDFSAQMTRCIGSNGVDKQKGKSAAKMNTLNSFLYSFTQVIFAFLGDGYIRTYRQAEESSDLWPTAHYTNKRAFWFWTWSTTKVACKTLKGAFSTDVRAEILVKKEHLFIVYEDGPPEGDPFFDLPFIRKKEESLDNHSFKGAYIFH
ncbi:conserved hypothetical protein [Theileria equi strain WA]|uniref:Uncharacterized protein n=1 Tax=Theileria equi strain WA TaxID=1537102 RepID=L1LEC6_THEEQ|nr:conserved hypothetical protein [Theileria equi strain WA]EKX73639.1 conserved hypothetical protein [Theileria equi strain WA]|eukprot:XP_004833091.1 conserved hypothetical protein [Theileria equi strain WA]